MAAVHERGQKSRSEGQQSRSSRPTGTVSHLSGHDTAALTWDFAYELNTRPSPCTGRGPRIGRRKTRLTCGAPLRNRTVDLLLTMDHPTVPVSAAAALSRQNTSSRERRRAQISPHRLHFAPQNAPRNDLHLAPIRQTSGVRARIRSSLLACLRPSTQRCAAPGISRNCVYWICLDVGRSNAADHALVRGATTKPRACPETRRRRSRCGRSQHKRARPSPGEQSALPSSLPSQRAGRPGRSRSP